jgi:hypothetical protein
MHVPYPHRKSEAPSRRAKAPGSPLPQGEVGRATLGFIPRGASRVREAAITLQGGGCLPHPLLAFGSDRPLPAGYGMHGSFWLKGS